METAARNNFIIILILGMLSTITPFSIDLYLPAFPQIAQSLHTTQTQVSLSVSLYFIGMAFGQVVYGPLLDRYGRKKPLYVGLVLFMLASLGCIQAKTVGALVIFRLFQALGGCAAQVAAMAMVRDFFPVEKSAKVLSLLMLILGVSPLLAPTVGGFVAVHLGWQWIFIILICIVLFILALVAFVLPEGHQPDKTISLKPGPILKNFRYIFQEPSFYTYALAGSFSFSGLLVYVTGSPIIFMNDFHVSPQTYGIIFALLAVGFLSSNQLNIALLKHFHTSQLFKAALIVQCALGATLLICMLSGYGSLIPTTVFIFLLLGCLGMTYPNGTAIALAPFSKNAGSAASLIGCLQIGLAALVSAGIGLLNSSNSLPVFIILALTPILGLGILLIGKKRISYNELDAAEPTKQ